MSETTNLKLKKHDNVTTNTNQFDIENYMNDNWDKVDEFAGQVNTELEGLNNYDDTEVKQEIADIKQEQTEQNTKIENLDLNKASKTELQEATIALQAELLATKKDYEAGTLEGQEEGESLYLQDSSNARFREFGIGGNDKQATRSGKNKLDLSKIQQRTLNGVTCTYNAENKSVTLNGTCTADNTGFAIGDSGLATKKLVKDKTTLTAYYVSGECTGTGTMSVQAHATGYVSNVPLTDLRDLKELKLRTATYSSSNFPEMELMMVNVRVNEEAILDNFTFKLMLTDEVDEVDTEYEDFGAMPSLEFPSETEAVGQDVNLFDKDNVEFYNNNSSNFSCTINAGPTRVRTSSFEFAGEGPYTLSGLIGKTRLLGVRAYGENENIISEGATLNENTFTLTEEVKYIHLLFKNSDDSELNREEVRNMPIKIEKGKQASAYSAYGCGSANITVCNKNVCDNIFEQGVINVSNGKNGPWNNTKYIRTKNYIKIKPNTQFVMTNPIKNRGRKTRFYDKDKNYLGYTAKKDSLLANNDDATLKRVSTMPDNAYYLRFELDFDDAQIGQDVIDGKYKYQLEEGNTATDYIAHEEQTVAMPVQEPMLEGDEFDWDNEEEVHTWSKVELTGNETGWFKSSTTMTNAYGIKNEKIGLPVLTENTSKCTHFKYADGVTATSTSKYISQLENLYLSFPLDIAKTLEEFKSLMQEQVDAETPVTIYYKLETPTKLPFTEAQKAVAKQIRQTLHSYKGGTHVYCTDEISPIFNVKYTIDQKAYIQAEIEKIAKGVINNV